MLTDIFSQSATGKLWAQTEKGTVSMDASEAGNSENGH